MRQRKVKDLDAKMEAVSKWLVREPAPEVWEPAFGSVQKLETTGGLYLEIGCGRGDFLLQQALQHPENNYIGIEGQPSVVLRAMEKAARIEMGMLEPDDPQWMRDAVAGLVSAERQDAVERSAEQRTAGEQIEEETVTTEQIANCRYTDNVRFACLFVNEILELFYPGSLAGIFLNFSDPWPKARHAKRRLTWRGRLQDYARALRPGGFIAVKTDNDALFEFTLEEITACGWTPAECTRDLHGPEGEPYEARRIMTEYERKFHEAGKNINYVKVVV